jgi:hypothetical protein
MKKFAMLAAALTAVCAAAAAPAATPDCGRSCLYERLDQYLQALKSRTPTAAGFIKDARYVENNVQLQPGDGVWGTLTALGTYALRFADPVSGEVGYYGTLDESVSAAPFALRLKVRAGRIVEAETVVARQAEAGVPFLTAEIASRPEFEAVLPPQQRVSRERMIAAANGYFDTLQRNDGKLHVEFEDGCNRREDGMQTTNNPNPDYPTFSMGCAEQFRLGMYRYDDALRARRFEVVDEERGLVLATAFIDHSGRIGSYTWTDGRKAESMFRRPHSYYLMETFKIRSGRIQAVEAVFTTVPYGMPRPVSGTAAH